MTNQEIKELAGHREVPPWVMKLVADAVAKAVEHERNECVKLCETYMDTGFTEDGTRTLEYHSYLIRQRGNK